MQWPGHLQGGGVESLCCSCCACVNCTPVLLLLLIKSCLVPPLLRPARRYGHPVPTQVRLTPVKGKAVLISGHDMTNLEQLLIQTAGTVRVCGGRWWGC